MEANDNPLEAFLKWYGTLHPDHRVDIAYFASVSFPCRAFEQKKVSVPKVSVPIV